MSKSETIEALAKILAERLTWTEDAPQIAAAIEEAIYKGEIPCIAKQSHDGHSLWMCPKCKRTRDGRGCMTCLEVERDALRVALEHALIGMEIGCNIAYRKWAEDDEDESWSIMRDHLNNIHASLSPPTSTTPDASGPDHSSAVIAKILAQAAEREAEDPNAWANRMADILEPPSTTPDAKETK